VICSIYETIREFTPKPIRRCAFNQLSSARSLVLNSSYQPVKLVSWQKAMMLWFQDKVEVLEYHNSTVVRSARQNFQLPSILRLKKYVSPRKTTRIKFSRENVYLRDNYTCQYCALKFSLRDLTLDHVVPASKMGRKDWTNVVTACRDCNHRKANRTPFGAGMPLLTEPRVPNWLPPMRQEFAIRDIPLSWEPYLASYRTTA
jgi:5-methylcytosine-specific restriction endonuclease McrA